MERYHLGVAAPIVAEGDLMGCVMLLMGEHDAAPTESEQTLAPDVRGIFGKADGELKGKREDIRGREAPIFSYFQK